jgi:hypothetical protein
MLQFVQRLTNFYFFSASPVRPNGQSQERWEFLDDSASIYRRAMNRVFYAPFVPINRPRNVDLFFPTI